MATTSTNNFNLYYYDTYGNKVTETTAATDVNFTSLDPASLKLTESLFYTGTTAPTCYFKGDKIRFKLNINNKGAAVTLIVKSAITAGIVTVDSYKIGAAAEQTVLNSPELNGYEIPDVSIADGTSNPTDGIDTVVIITGTIIS